MSSEIRANTLKNRVGLSTINITQEDFKTKEEYNAFLIKNREIGLLINSVKQRLNSHITKSSKLIQGQG